MKLILASKSPRRREILGMLGLHIEILTLDTAEEGDREHCTPDALVRSLAAQKVKAAWENVKDRPDAEDLVVLSADTIVYHNGRVLEKPKDHEDARNMLHALSGDQHQVYTGYAVVYRGKTADGFSRTDVQFRALSDAEIDAYVATGDPMDKAGAYAAQGRASLFVEKIEGDYFNVVGLPASDINVTMKKTFGFGLTEPD